jgi:nickel transport protein
VRWLWLAFGLLLCLPVSAHKLKVFATAEGDRILGQAYFVGGAGAGGAAIRIVDAGGRVLARPEPDVNGNFSYAVERRMDYQVVADSLDGHLASWTLRADEFSPDLPGTQAMETSDKAHPVAPVSREQDIPASRTVPDAASLSHVEAAVARQIRPLRVALQAHEEQVRLRDIVGGIGYIVGLAGLGFWWSARRRNTDR